MRYLGAILLLLCVGCGESRLPVEPAPGQPFVFNPPPPPSSPIFLDQKQAFDDAIRDLGTPILVDFEDVDARPVSDTIAGRSPFDGRRYSTRGVTFSNPNNLVLYVAPGGLFWNSSNSISVGRFPFDPVPHILEAPFIEDDDLVVGFEPGCSAVAFSVIDGAKSEGSSPNDFIQFFDTRGELVYRVEFPRAFLGVVSPDRAIARIDIWEGANDADDVTYDDFLCVR